MAGKKATDDRSAVRGKGPLTCTRQTLCRLSKIVGNGRESVESLNRPRLPVRSQELVSDVHIIRDTLDPGKRTASGLN